VHRHHALLAPLAQDGHREPTKVQVTDVKPAELGHSETTAVEKLEHGMITSSTCSRQPVGLGGSADLGDVEK
jgi:hypothetical protein